MFAAAPPRSSASAPTPLSAPPASLVGASSASVSSVLADTSAAAALPPASSSSAEALPHNFSPPPSGPSLLAMPSPPSRMFACRSSPAVGTGASSTAAPTSLSALAFSDLPARVPSSSAFVATPDSKSRVDCVLGDRQLGEAVAGARFSCRQVVEDPAPLGVPRRPQCDASGEYLVGRRACG
mmetsp:Transcript_19348/g.48400  ORF Transcript_19348/g.48400 Transcript_19348/m.48400 type:complete len:182 (-) Transcript_19348:1229-1774(-)